VVDVSGLPGEWLVRKGLADLERGELSPEALTLSLATQRLLRLGIEVRTRASLPRDRELALYAALTEAGVDDPYSRYNSLVRELASLLEALEHQAHAGR
jgi:hypothetical protein